MTMAMATLLGERGVKPIVVVPGREFARTNSGYRLRWNEPSDYRKLVEAIGPAASSTRGVCGVTRM